MGGQDTVGDDLVDLVGHAHALAGLLIDLADDGGDVLIPLVGDDRLAVIIQGGLAGGGDLIDAVDDGGVELAWTLSSRSNSFTACQRS